MSSFSIRLQKTPQDINRFSETVSLHSANWPFSAYGRIELLYKIDEHIISDSFRLEEAGKIVTFCGLVHNKKEILNKYAGIEWPTLFLSRTSSHGLPQFLHELNGSFCGFIYDINNCILNVFTDHVGSRPVYIYSHANGFFVDTSLKNLAISIRRANLPLNLSTYGSYCLLAYGFMVDNSTLIESVEKISSATIQSISQTNNNLIIKSNLYWQGLQLLDVSGLETYRSYKESVNLLIDRFKSAVALEYEKDTEYHRSHIATLSGGLDSRSCLFYATSLGIKGIKTICYSQSGYLEEIIAKKISAYCNCGYIYFSLDGGDYLLDIDKAIASTEGMTTFRPIAHSLHVFSFLTWEKFGLLHTGLLGDAVIGGIYCGNNKFSNGIEIATRLNPKNIRIMNSRYKEKATGFFNAITDFKSLASFNSSSAESVVFKNRGLNGILQSNLGASQFTNTASPFLNKDVLEASFEVPSKFRENYRFYLDWLKQSIPEATKFVWEGTGMRPVLWGTPIPPKSIPVKVRKLFLKMISSEAPEPSRHPYVYWLNRNKFLNAGLSEYFDDHIFLLERHPDILLFANAAMEWGEVCSQLRVITLLGSIKYLGLEASAYIDPFDLEC